MEVSGSLLVAMMYVMVLSIGIGNILMGLSSLIHRHTFREVDWLPTSWLLLLLLFHMNLFWHTLAILDVEEWGFGGFLYVVSGPTLLLLATSLLLADPALAEPGEPRLHYFRVAARFFPILAILMLWLIGVDFVLGVGFTGDDVWNVLSLLLFLFLSRTQEFHVHTVATAATWVLSVSLMTFRSLGIVS